MAASHVVRLRRPRALLALVWATPLYWLVAFPACARELRRWRRRAQAIPDPVVRRHALAKLAEEHLSAEGAAAFAILAGRRHRRGLIRACVAFEVLYDHLDALTEAQPTLEYGRRLHRALAACFALDAPDTDGDPWAGSADDPDDGGYLHALVTTCREQLRLLPGHRQVAPALQRIALRAAEAQSLNHAGIASGHDALERWALQQVPPAAAGELRWWEVAAGAGSPLGVFALLATACDARATSRAADAVEAAYFPWIAALHWLLDSAVDRADDVRTGNHSYVEHYGSGAEAAQRLALVAQRAVADAWRLPRGARHVLLLAGMVAMNLSHRDAGDPAYRDALAAVRSATGAIVLPFLLMLRLRRLLRRAAALLASGPGRARRA